MNIGEIYFDKYKIFELLGQGGTSHVYLAENIKLGTKWAIKKALKKNNDTNLLAEPNILKLLNHAAIPRIIDIEENEEAIYIIEEYVDGINLKAYKSTMVRLEEDQIVEWALQLCDVLNYLHSFKPNPIIYRDMKPDNIILMDQGNLKLVDFGIAREYKSESSNDTVPIGTRGYAAPEQYGIGQSDERTDIFALGMTLYYLFTNKNLSVPPYKIQITEQLNNNASYELQRIISKCCEILPDQRFQSVKEVEAALHSLKHHELPIEKKETQEKTLFKTNRNIEGAHIKKTSIIGLLGVSRCIGVTHTAILIGNILSKKNRVAILELNTSNHFREIAIQIQEDKGVKEKNFRHQKIHYYWDIGYSEFLMRYRDQFDVILLDLGCYEEIMDINEFIRCDMRLVVSQCMDWKVREIENFCKITAKYDPNQTWKFVAPFIEKKVLKEIQCLKEKRCYAIPFNMNPFLPNNECKKLIEDLIYGK